MAGFLRIFKRNVLQMFYTLAEMFYTFGYMGQNNSMK